MIENINLEVFKKEYQKFKETKDYEFRKSQSKFVEVAKLVIRELIKKEKFSNEDLTALIQMFGYNCKKETFHSYLLSLRLPKYVEEDIYNRFIDIGETGYTGIGKAAIKGLNEIQLEDVKKFLKLVSEAKNEADVKKAYEQYKEKNIPQVTRGVYSPWLHYIQPKICPIIAGPVAAFFSKVGMAWSASYSDFLDIFEELKNNVGEEDLGLIDSFFWDERRRNSIITKPNGQGKDIMMLLLENKKQVILYGPPGTGKTYNTKKIAIKLIK